jgi:hypothetical protein
MKTVLISEGDIPPPKPLVDVIARGSTSVERRSAADLLRQLSVPDADRIVFWSTGSDPQVRQLAVRYRSAERAERREALVFVTAAAGEAIPGLTSAETFVWPQDRDRLMMAFLTGA